MATVVDHPLIAHKLTLMRDVNTPSPLFRQLLREISVLLTFEVFRDLDLTSIDIETPVCPTTGSKLVDGICLVPVLRAGGGFLDGLLDVVPTAVVGHVGVYRDEVAMTPVEYYLKFPKDMPDCLTVVIDPMLATGESGIEAVNKVKQVGAREIRFLALVAAPEGVSAFEVAHPDVKVFTAALDERLNEKSYIVPGLGDAGDRLFGTG